MLTIAEQQGWIRGFNPSTRSQGELQLTHLLYADDSLIFCDPDRDQILHLKMILLFFEAVSGLHINYSKSVLYPVNEIHNIQEIAETLGCKVGTLPTKYLGLPLGAKANSQAIWDDILEKCEKKLSCWKRNYLSLGGRLVLINSVMDSLPTYTMSLFPLPVSVAKRLDKLRRDFLWQGNREHRTFNLVRWEKVTTERKMGGLGVKNVLTQNSSLLHKWLWRFSQEENALWRSIIAAKYGILNPWTTKQSSTHGPYGPWRHIRKYWDSFHSNTFLQTGNGMKISFWKDIWIGESSLMDQYPILFSIAQNQEATISEYWNGHGWNFDFRRSINDWELSSVSSMLLQLQSCTLSPSKQDTLHWKGDPQGKFTVRGCYQFLSRINTSIPNWPWKCIWKNKAPLKVECFTWVVAHGACLTHDNLQKRGVNICSRCSLCERQTEDVNHLFIHCTFTKQLWDFILSIVGIQWSMPRTTEELLHCWSRIGLGKVKMKIWNTLRAAVWWSIWKERNARIFESKSESVITVKGRCISLLIFWCNMANANDTEAMIDFLSSLHDM